MLPGVILESKPETHPSKKEIAKALIPVNNKTLVRYIKIIALNYGVLPEWHEAAGSQAWIFVDEIIVK